MKNIALRITAVSVLLLAGFLLNSCPEPFQISDLEILEDTTGPQLTLTGPNEGDLYQDKVAVSGSTIDIDASGEQRSLEDPAALPTLTWAVTGEEASGTIEVGDDGGFSVEIPTTTYSEDISIELKAVDRNNNATAVIRRLLYDSRGPNITVSSPIELSVFGKTVSVNGTVANSDNSAPSNVATLSYEVVNTAILDDIVFDPATGAFSFEFDTTGINENILIRIQASDSQGDVATFYRQLSNDAAGPLITILGPADYSEFASSIPVTGTVSNGESDTGLDEVATLSYSAINGAQSGSVPYDILDGSFSFVVDATGIKSDIIIIVAATDIHGNGTTRSIVLINDNTGPYIALTSPVDGYFSTVVQLSGSVQNSVTDTTLTEVDLSSVEYRIPGTVIGGTFLPGDIDAGGNFSTEVDMSTVSTNCVFEVVALDLNGNETVVQVNLLKPAGGGDINVSATVDNGAVIFTWDDVPGATNYRIEEFVFGGIRDGVTLDAFDEYTWDGLQNGTFHEFQVIATVPGYETAVSSDIVIAPMSQMTFRPWFVNGSYGSITVEWTPSGTSGARFLLERQVNDGSWEALTVTTAITYSDTDVVKTNYYRYRLTLRNNGLDSLNQSVESVAVRAPYFPNGATIANESGTDSFYVVEKYEDTLFLCDAFSALHAYDVTDPLSPTLITTIPNVGTRFHLHWVDLTTAYIYVFSDWDDTVNIVDPETVSVVSSFDVPYSGGGLAVQALTSAGTNLYVAVGDRNSSTTDTGAVYIYDITSPTSPIEPPSSFDVEPAGVLAEGNYLYIARESSSGNGELLVADVSNPGSVTPISTGLTFVNNNNNRVNMTLGGSYLFVRDENASMRAYNVSTPTSPFEVANGGYTTYSAGDLYLYGNTLFVADLFAGGYNAFDVTNILNGTEDGDGAVNGVEPYDYSFSLDTDTSDLFVESGVMWTAQFQGGIVVIDLGIPSSITELSSVTLSGGAGDTNRLIFDGDRMLVLTGSTSNTTVDTFHLLDIGTDPESPVETDSVDVSGAFSWPGLGVAGDTAILSSIDTVDIGQSPPVYQSISINPSGREWKMQLRGDLAVLGTSVNDGITVVDVSKPTDPVEIATLLKGGKIAAEIFGDFVVSATANEVFLIDISNRDTPALLDSFLTSGGVTRDVYADRNYVFVLDGTFVEVLEIDRTAGTLTERPTYAVDLGAGLMPYEVLAQGDYLLVRSDNDIDTTKLTLLDISDIASITEVTSLTISSLDTDSMAWTGDLIYLGDNGARRIVVLKIE